MNIPLCPPLSLFWSSRANDHTPAAAIHRAYTRGVWRARTRLRLLAALLTWPWANLGLIAFFTTTTGWRIQGRRTDKGVVRQAWEQLKLCVVHSIPAHCYYIFDLFEDDKRKRASEYLHRYETKGGIYKLLRVPEPHHGKVLKDKVLFARMCQDLMIPAIPVLAILDRGSARTLDEQPGTVPLNVDLFVKLATGKGGRGAMRWDYAGAGRFTGGDGVSISAEQLLSHLITLSSRRRYIVQPRLRNHAAIADLSTGALVTARIMTCRDESGGIEVTNAAFRMAVGRNTVVDNFHAGGIAAAIDVATGRLGRATDLGLYSARGWCDVHPDSKAAIVGRTLPYWSEASELVRRAHALLSQRIVVGWDVAFLDDGALVVEGNGSPDLDIIQRTQGEPLGNARLGELLAFHVQRVSSAP
jgi:hypothetical protein